MSDHARYHRQMLLPGFGEEGQEMLQRARVAVIGCGALGTVIVDALARAGVGQLIIVDRDIVELTNLQRQVLFDEADVKEARPKALAAAAAVARINSDVRVDAHVDDFNPRNAERLIADADVLVDGLDNFETRYLLNDLAVRDGIPYVYGGAVATTGMSLVVLPWPCHPTRQGQWTQEQVTPCLRCVFPEAPPPGTSPTCDTAGVLGPAVMTIAAHQAAQTLKILTGNVDALDTTMLSIDMWSNQTRRFDIRNARSSTCRCCGEREFEYLQGTVASRTTSLCGRQAVQIIPAESDREQTLDFRNLLTRLESHGTFTANDAVLHGVLERERGEHDTAIELMIFANGRAIIRGTAQPETAKAIYAKYIGA